MSEHRKSNFKWHVEELFKIEKSFNVEMRKYY